MLRNFLSALSLTITSPMTVLAEEVGEVSTAFKLLGANHKIVVEAFDDPDVLSRTLRLSFN